MRTSCKLIGDAAISTGGVATETRDNDRHPDTDPRFSGKANEEFINWKIDGQSLCRRGPSGQPKLVVNTKHAQGDLTTFSVVKWLRENGYGSTLEERGSAVAGTSQRDKHLP